MDIYGESAITIDTDYRSKRHEGVMDRTSSTYSEYVTSDKLKAYLINHLGLISSQIDVLDIGLPLSYSRAPSVESFIDNKIKTGVSILVSDKHRMALADSLDTGYYIQTKNNRTFNAITQCNDITVGGVVFDSGSNYDLLYHAAKELAVSRYTKNKKIVFTNNPYTRIIYNTTGEYSRVVDILQDVRRNL